MRRPYALIGLLAALGCITAWPPASAAAAPATMQAVLVVDGKPQVRDVPRPVPGAGEVLVQVRAAGVNPADWKRAQRPSQSPVTPGWDIAGTISALGPGVTDWKVGDAVMGFFEAVGGYAQYATISVDMIARKPASMSFEQAAGVPLVAITAYKALVDVAAVQQGQRVLVHGGAGGVGSAAVQIAAARGAHVVTTASAKNHAYVKSIGAREAIDYTAVKFEEQVHDIDVVVNTVDEETAARSLVTLKPAGIMVTVAGGIPTAACETAHRRCGSPSRKDGAPIGAILAETGRLADAHRFAVNVDATFPLAKVEDAWALSRAGHTRGKIVLLLTPDRY